MKVNFARRGFDEKGRAEITFLVNDDKYKINELEIGKEYILTFSSRKKRSLDANAYFHLLVNKIARALNASDEEVKKRMVLEYGTIWKDGDVVVGFKLLENINPDFYPYCRKIGESVENNKKFNHWVLYKQTHTLDTKEMSELIEGVVYEAQELGIETLTPQELAKLRGLK